MTTDEVKANNPTKKAVKYDVQDWEEDFPEPKSPPGTLESIVDIAQREYREECEDPAVIVVFLHRRVPGHVPRLPAEFPLLKIGPVFNRSISVLHVV